MSQHGYVELCNEKGEGCHEGKKEKGNTRSKV
jgi:hypothetical protein